MLDGRLRLSPMLAADERFAFVAVGKLAAVRGARIVWLKTDAAILFAKCPQCSAKIGYPCVDLQMRLETAVEEDEAAEDDGARDPEAPRRTGRVTT